MNSATPSSRDGSPASAASPDLPTERQTRGPEASGDRPTRVRFGIVGMLFVVTAINYADRASLSLAGDPIAGEYGLDPVALGYAFSAFGWSYVACQLPGGWLLDTFGSRLVYGLSLITWSVFTFAQGFLGYFEASVMVVGLFAMRFLLGAAEAPSFPANSRIVAAWFPTAERGTASAIFNSAQYFALVIFSPLMGWIIYSFGWRTMFWVMGALGFVLAGFWFKFMHSPHRHPRVNAAELDHIEKGGGLVQLDRRSGPASRGKPDLRALRQLLTNRMLVGIYMGQFCITTLTYFFLTWFPVYLIRDRGMSILKAGLVASLPALCGFIGGVLGGIVSDLILRKGYSLTVARKIPIITGMLLSSSVVICNYVDSETLVVAVMALAFFGKGFGALGWAVVSDTSPKEIAGLSGGMFNTFGNLAGITTPIAIGYILSFTGSFTGALVFVAANAVGAIFCYLFLVGKIERVQLVPTSPAIR